MFGCKLKKRQHRTVGRAGKSAHGVCCDDDTQVLYASLTVMRTVELVKNKLAFGSPLNIPRKAEELKRFNHSNGVRWGVGDEAEELQHR